MPYVLNNHRANPTINIINSGFLRFDVYSGTFTRNDEYASANYADFFKAVYDVPFGHAAAVLGVLNGASPTKLARRKTEIQSVQEVYNRWLAEQRRTYVHVGDVTEPGPVLGYVTTDVRFFLISFSSKTQYSIY